MDIEENWKGCATHTSYWLNPTRRTQREKESSFCNPSRHKVEWRVESGSEWANRASLVQNLSKIYHYNYSLFSMLYYGMACIIWSWISMQFLWFTWKTSEITISHHQKALLRLLSSIYCLLYVLQSFKAVRLSATLWTATGHASLSFPISQSLLKLMSTEAAMSFNHLIFCHPLLLLSIFPSIRVFSNELALRIRASIGASVLVLPMNIQGWIPLGLTSLISLQSKGLSRVFSRRTVGNQFF